MTDSKLQSIVDRIEGLEEKRKALLGDQRRIYVEAERAGFNAKALRKIIAERRMPDRDQIVAKMQAYRDALRMAVNDVVNGASLRETAAKRGVPKSTIQRHAVPRQEKTEMGQPVEDDSPGNSEIPASYAP